MVDAVRAHARVREARTADIVERLVAVFAVQNHRIAIGVLIYRAIVVELDIGVPGIRVYITSCRTNRQHGDAL